MILFVLLLSLQMVCGLIDVKRSTNWTRGIAQCALPIFTTFNRAYINVVVVWIKSMRNVGLTNCIFVVGISPLEAPLCASLREILHFSQIFCQDVVGNDTESATASYWRVRTQLVVNLAESVGKPFINCDSDAFWVRDISNDLLLLQANGNYNFIFSRGLGWPKFHMDTYGFTHCLGFWMVNPTPLTVRFLKEIPDGSKDDQVAINVLTHEWDVKYTKEKNDWCGVGNDHLKVRNIGFDIVDRRCPSHAPILHCLSTKRASSKLLMAESHVFSMQ